jgi:hypothetical protein
MLPRSEGREAEGSKSRLAEIKGRGLKNVRVGAKAVSLEERPRAVRRRGFNER